MNHTRLALLTALSTLVAACGGGGDSAAPAPAPSPSPSPSPSPTPNGTGRFIDSEVSGLDYNCGGVTGTTTNLGEFQFVAGQTCTFSVGGITLGSGLASQIMFPVNLVNGAQPGVANAAVTDIARLLISLDNDGDPNNGIVITQAVRTALAGASLTGANAFGNGGFTAAAQALVTQAIPGRTLVSTAVADQHLDLSLVNLWSGGYQCQYFADVNGTKTLLGNVAVSITQGAIVGAGTPLGGGGAFDVSGNVGANGQAILNAATGTTSTGATFSGSFETIDGTPATTTGSGIWDDPSFSTVTGKTWTCQHT